ncbi:MAG: hypothetical protein GTN49_04400 [candidate division Zixibacteria bacterium]|nr:hypothetical protein [candidate division Zixibacteria bacterium]
MSKWTAVIFAVAGLVAATAGTAGAAFVKGSVTAGFVLPQMDMPRANAWVKTRDVEGFEKRLGREGEFGDITPGMGFGVGYGVTLGDYFRIDAFVANMRKEHEVTYTAPQYERTVRLTTHILPVRVGGTFLMPGLLGGRIKPEMGLGIVTFIVNYDTFEEFRLIGVPVTGGTAWTRDVCYGPELRLGAEFTVFGPLAVEAYGTYWTGEATLVNWAKYGEVPLTGPTSEDFTGWAIWFAPRFYL